MKRITLGVLVAMLIAVFTLPQVVAAGSGFSYKVLSNSCNSRQAAVLKVEFRSAGSTRANKLTIDSRGEYTSLFGSGSGKPQLKRAVFTANGTSHKLTLQRTYGGRIPEAVERLVFRLRAWSNNTLLYDKTIKSQWC